MMPDPRYRQIADDLRQKIESGELGPQLPTELELREHYAASRNTVRDAIRLLVTRGLVETRPGQGTFVVQQIKPFITTLLYTDEAALPAAQETGLGGEGTAYAAEVSAAGRKAQVSVPRVELLSAVDTVAAELRLTADSSVVSRHQQRLIDGIPWSLQTTFYPMRLVEQGAVKLIQTRDISAGTVAYLEETLGIKQAGWRDRITVRAPTTPEALFFALPDDGRVTVFDVQRTGFDEQGMPFRLTVSVYPADRNQLTVSVGQVPGEVRSKFRDAVDDEALDG